MGIFKSAIFNKAKGRVGNIVFSQSEDNEIIAKSVPTPSQKPPSAGQLEQRSLFSTVLVIALSFKNYLQELFASTGKRRSGFNSFMSNALQTAKSEGVDTIDQILELVDVSNGTALSEQFGVISASGTGAGDTSLTIKSTLGTNVPAGDNKLNDIVHVLVICPSLQMSKLINTTVKRVNLPLSTDVETFKAADNYIAIMFKDNETGAYSNSKVVAKYNAITGIFTAY